ncbi:hypothetical protein [Chenggangzhangella methanolivorans]|uniref:Uncharacterized protein n=1 Tax=Chenggangzhangella methanolivorans TaxID=1437009 RepID=A0A9E6UQR8_9HYPH|nr:hypothetical protein [Chenggangzhangella methanolivorans]QZO01370.1 hypothetical protein K6K41_07875 [Chenggangzhangella methanolivorans]
MRVADPVDEAGETELLELLEAARDVGARDRELPGQLVGVHRAADDEQIAVDLRDRAVHAPARAHLSPMQDEAFHQRRHL